MNNKTEDAKIEQMAPAAEREACDDATLTIRRVRVSAKVKAGGTGGGGCRVISAVTWFAAD